MSDEGEYFLCRSRDPRRGPLAAGCQSRQHSYGVSIPRQ